MEYQIEYIPHDSDVPPSQVHEYGKLATHDLRIPILLLYEKDGVTYDKDGQPVEINAQFVTNAMNLTNKFIENRHKNPLAKLISKWRKPIDEVTSIPIQKDHDNASVDKKIGHIEGLTFTEIVKGDWNGNGKQTEKLCLFGYALITKLTGKIDVDSGILRESSVGLRPDNSIKEVSMVSNEALPLCGLMFSEPSFIKEAEAATLDVEIKSPIKKPKAQKNNKAIELAEQINGLQLAEQRLEHTIIPNHMIISRMIKNGKLKPYQYDNALSMDRKTLEFMEHSIPSRELGLVLGTNKPVQKIESKDFKFEQLVAEAQEKLGTKKDKPKDFEMIRQDFNFEETRTKELKRMLELAEGSPELIKQYIKCELGNEFVEPSYRDECLDEYMVQLSEIKKQLKSLQFGE